MYLYNRSLWIYRDQLQHVNVKLTSEFTAVQITGKNGTEECFKRMPTGAYARHSLFVVSTLF